MRWSQPAWQLLRKGIRQPSCAMWPPFGDCLPILLDRLDDERETPRVEIFIRTEPDDPPDFWPACPDRGIEQTVGQWGSSSHQWGNNYVMLTPLHSHGVPTDIHIAFDPEIDRDLLRTLLDHDALRILPSEMEPIPPGDTWVVRVNPELQPANVSYNPSELAEAIEQSVSDQRLGLGPPRVGDSPQGLGRVLLTRAAQQLGGWIAAEEIDDASGSVYMFERFIRLIGEVAAADLTSELLRRWVLTYIPIWNPTDLSDPRVLDILVSDANKAAKRTISSTDRQHLRELLTVALDVEQSLDNVRQRTKLSHRRQTMLSLRVIQGGAMTMTENRSSESVSLTELVTGFLSTEGLPLRD